MSGYAEVVANILPVIHKPQGTYIRICMQLLTNVIHCGVAA